MTEEEIKTDAIVQSILAKQAEMDKRIELYPVVDPNNQVLLFDIFVDGEWHGSRSTYSEAWRQARYVLDPPPLPPQARDPNAPVEGSQAQAKKRQKAEFKEAEKLEKQGLLDTLPAERVRTYLEAKANLLRYKGA